MNRLLEASEEGKDRRLNLLVLASFVTAVALIAFGLVAVPRILESASTTRAIDQQSDVAACRAAYRTVLVDDPMSQLQVARARLDERTNEGLEAVATGDEVALAALLDTLPSLRANVERTAAALEDGTAHYRDLVALSAADVDAFLTECTSEETAP